MQTSTYTKTMISKELSMKFFTRKLLVLSMLDLSAVSSWLLEADSAEDLVSVANFIVGLVALLLKTGNVLRLPFELVTETDPLSTGGLVTSFLKIDVLTLFDC